MSYHLRSIPLSQLLPVVLALRACGFLSGLLLLGIAHGASPSSLQPPLRNSATAAEKSAQSTPVTVAADPATVNLNAGASSTQTTYRFRNSTPGDFQVIDRTAFFHSLTNDWQSGLIGPIPTDLKLNPLGETEWKDRPALPAGVRERAQKAGALDDHQLLFVQTFTLRAPSGETTRAAAAVIFRTDAEPAPTERIELPHHVVTVLTSLRADPVKNVQLLKLLTFAEAAYEKLSALLGFTPNGGQKIPLRITEYGGVAHYRPGKDAFVNIPCEVLESQSDSEWLFVVYPHELAHYFLLEEFPNPPRWFVEGPASFFGGKVADALGYHDATRQDRSKILGWAGEYTAQRHQYLFQDTWPGDGTSPGEGYSLGLGRGYELCGKLEEFCGPQIFAGVFRQLRASRVPFTNARSEKERNELLIAALQTQTDRDVWAFFAREGFGR